jgi:hypothetical protein
MEKETKGMEKGINSEERINVFRQNAHTQKFSNENERGKRAIKIFATLIL